MTALRWAVFLPAGFAAGWLAWFLGRALNRLSYSYVVGAWPGWWMDAGFDIMGHLYMGVAIPYVALRIAPSQDRRVVVVVALVVLSAAFTLAVVAALARHYLALACAAAAFVAATLVVNGFYTARK